MRAVIQRVTKASVTVENKVVAQVDEGILALLAVANDDEEKDAFYMAEKLTNLRVFNDSQGKINLSLKDINGSMLLVSQFSLYADTKKGRRPSFIKAAEPKKAKDLFDKVVALTRKQQVLVQEGVFGAKMVVKIINDGPLTLIVDSKQN